MYMHMFSLAMFAALPSPTMDSTKVGGREAAAHLCGGGSEAVASIVGDGEAANIAKTYAYTYQMCPYLYILLIYRSADSSHETYPERRSRADNRCIRLQIALSF